MSAVDQEEKKEFNKPWSPPTETTDIAPTRGTTRRGQTVERGAALTSEEHQLVEGVLGWSVDEETGVETIGPAGVRSGGQFVAFEQIVDVFQDEKIRIEKDTFRVSSQQPTVDLRECHAQLRSIQQLQIFHITGIQLVDVDQLVEHFRQRFSKREEAEEEEIRPLSRRSGTGET